MQVVKPIKILHTPKKLHEPHVYELAMELEKQGYGYRRISKMLGIPEGTVNSWLYMGKNPTNKLNSFDSTPSPELSYVVGAVLGDGCLFYSRGYWIQLVVKDREFVDYFSQCLAKLLKRKEAYPLFERNDNNGQSKMYGVRVASKLFWSWLKEWEVHKNVIESNPESFLRGLYDSEGSICKYREKEHLAIILANTKRELLELAKNLLKKLGIDSRIYAINDRRKNHKICYRLVITSKDNLLLFYDKVGFTIKRKQQRLENLARTIRELRAYGIDDRRARWRPSGEELHELYWNKGLLQREIAKKCCVSVRTVRNRMKMLGIPRRDSKFVGGTESWLKKL